MTTLSLLAIGFSFGSALLLLLAHLNCQHYQDKGFTRLAGIVLLISLCYLQYTHLIYLQGDTSIITTRLYSLTLFMIAPSFYIFCQVIVSIDKPYHHKRLVHFIPALLCLLVPQQYLYPHALLLAFLLGTGYLITLSAQIYPLRDQRKRFKLEFAGLSVLFIVAVIVLLLGLSIPLLQEHWFFSLYAILIGTAFFIVTLLLLRAPTLLADVEEAVSASYTASTLNNIDDKKLLQQLDELMQQEKLYSQENLSLSMLAELMDLTPHQLSELVNTRLNKGFSQYIREQRVTAAQQLLITEPTASVLSIGLSVGFTTQSNFYAAFKDIVGMPPGQYRKQQV